MNVNRTPELESLIQKKVESGRYISQATLWEALGLLEGHEKTQAAPLSNVRRRIDEGLESLGRGEAVDGEPFMAKLISDRGGRPTKRKAR